MPIWMIYKMVMHYLKISIVPVNIPSIYFKLVSIQKDTIMLDIPAQDSTTTYPHIEIEALERKEQCCRNSFITFNLKAAFSEVEEQSKLSPISSIVTAKVENIKANNYHHIAKCSVPRKFNSGPFLNSSCLHLVPVNTQVTACYNVRNKYSFL